MPADGPANEPTYGILAKLDNVTRVGPGQWSARCPIHDDGKNSLSIGTGDDNKALLHCHVCGREATPQILNFIGATYSDLFPGRMPSASHSGKPSLTERIKATYDYRDANGQLLYQSVRLHSPKDFRQRKPKPDGNGWEWKVSGVARVLYKLPELIASSAESPDNPLPIYIVEGEKDADLLAAAGFIATTNVGGASKNPDKPKWLKKYSEQLKGRHVVILPDNDDAGRAHASAVARLTAPFAESIRVVDLSQHSPELPLKGDVSDWVKLSDENKPSLLREIVEATPLYAPPESEDGGRLANPKPQTPNKALHSPSPNTTAKPVESEDDPARLARIVLSVPRSTFGGDINDREQSVHQAVFKLEGTPNYSRHLVFWKDEAYDYNGERYVPVPQKAFRSQVNAICKAEFDRINISRLAGPQYDDKPAVTRRVTARLVNDVVDAMSGIRALHDIEINSWIGPAESSAATNPYDGSQLIAMQNGILDLTTLLSGDDSKPHLLPHTPNLFSTVCLPFPFDVDADCPTWLDFLQRNLEGDAERIALLQEWFGYCLTADTSLQKFLLMEGEGSNGKSVICAALTALLGHDNISHVPLEHFGERFYLTQTIGKLANVVSEVGEIDKIAEGFLKSFTSGDRMTFDRKNRDPIEAVPTARLILATNNRPRFGDRSGGLWRRMILLPLTVTIAEDDPARIPGMDKSAWWQASGELPGIFLWAIAGLHSLRQSQRFTHPAICKAALDDYRSESNPARTFLLESCLLADNGFVPTQKLYEHYSGWCKTNNYRPLGERTFGKEVKRAFPAAEKKRRGQRGDRFMAYTGILYNPEATDSGDETADESGNSYFSEF